MRLVAVTILLVLAGSGAATASAPPPDLLKAYYCVSTDPVWFAASQVVEQRYEACVPGP